MHPLVALLCILMALLEVSSATLSASANGVAVLSVTPSITPTHIDNYDAALEAQNVRRLVYTTAKNVSAYCDSLSAPHDFFFADDSEDGRASLHGTYLGSAIATLGSPVLKDHAVELATALKALQPWMGRANEAAEACRTDGASRTAHLDTFSNATTLNSNVEARQETIDCAQAAWILRRTILPGLVDAVHVVEANFNTFSLHLDAETNTFRLPNDMHAMPGDDATFTAYVKNEASSLAGIIQKRMALAYVNGFRYMVKAGVDRYGGIQQVCDANEGVNLAAAEDLLIGATSNKDVRSVDEL